MNTIEIKVSADTGPIDSLITKLERAVELQKQLTQEPLQTKKATLANLIDVTPAAFGVVVSWNVWWPGKVRVYSKYRHGDEVIEMYGLAVSSSQQSYLINGLAAGQSIECHVRFYDNDGGESFRSNIVTGKASADASEILSTYHTGGYLSNKQTYNIQMGIHIDERVFSGTIVGLAVKPQATAIEQLQKDVAAIITNATDTQHQVEQVNHQREKDFNALSKALRAIEKSITLLGHRDSFIR